MTVQPDSITDAHGGIVKGMRRRGFLVSASSLAIVGLSACGTSEESAAGAQPKLMVNDPWVRTTTGKKDPKMTGAFMDIANPTGEDRVLVKATTNASDHTELHKMVMVDGKKMMEEAKDGIPVPKEGHRHLVSGGYHLMLMKLGKELKIGDEVEITLEFDDKTVIKTTAMVKEFVEEEDHYHKPKS